MNNPTQDRPTPIRPEYEKTYGRFDEYYTRLLKGGHGEYPNIGSGRGPRIVEIGRRYGGKYYRGYRHRFGFRIVRNK